MTRAEREAKTATWLQHVRAWRAWTAHRVSSLRRVRGIRAYKSAEKTGEWLTMSEATAKLGVSNHQIRRLIKEGALLAEQVVFDAPWQIRASDLENERVRAALERKGRPCRVIPENQTEVARSFRTRR